jgi:hypothetical protein
MMDQAHCVEVEFDDHFYEALLSESERLQVDVEQVIERAAAAWVTDMEEGSAG